RAPAAHDRRRRREGRRSSLDRSRSGFARRRPRDARRPLDGRLRGHRARRRPAPLRGVRHRDGPAWNDRALAGPCRPPCRGRDAVRRRRRIGGGRVRGAVRRFVGRAPPRPARQRARGRRPRSRRVCGGSGARRRRHVDVRPVSGDPGRARRHSRRPEAHARRGRGDRRNRSRRTGAAFWRRRQHRGVDRAAERPAAAGGLAQRHARPSGARVPRVPVSLGRRQPRRRPLRRADEPLVARRVSGPGAPAPRDRGGRAVPRLQPGARRRDGAGVPGGGMSAALLSVANTYEDDVVSARQRARQIASLLGFDVTGQTRIATAVSEIARNAFVYAGGGRVEFSIEGATPPQLLIAKISDKGKGIGRLKEVLSGRYESATGMGIGIVGARRLMDHFDIDSTTRGTTVTLKKMLPRRSPLLGPSDFARLAERLAAGAPTRPIDEVRQQNQELLRTLEDLNQRQQELVRLNRELEDTNRGVVALYAELDERADHLRRADEIKTRFLSNMTHEFRTPVNSIIALTTLLNERLGTPADTKDEVYYIRQSAQQLSDIVNDLLDLAKVEAGKIDVHPAPFEVAGLFGALRGMLRPLLVNQSLALVFDDPDGVPPLHTDESKVSQVLRNFISNALKYTERGHVRVSAQLTADRSRVEFRVADTGIGIPERDLARIFDEFVQIENPLQRRVKGTGLGLPLSKRLAELLGGSISVQSELGVGSTFAL